MRSVTEPPARTLSGVRLVVTTAATFAAFAAFLFVPAGRWDWGLGWAYLGLFAGYVVIGSYCLGRWNPELIDARTHFPTGTKTWDKVWAALYAPGFMAVYIVAALDAVRFGWSSMSFAWWPLGFALFAAGSALLLWAMVVNPFFEKTVRIQHERGHHVIDTGPYQWVRHPGYLGFLGWIGSAPLLLGSWWAWVPAFASVVGLAIRTELEDRTLQTELEGYADYAQRVRWRLVPGIW